MKRKIDELLTGTVQFRQPRLLLSKEKISANIESGQTLRGEVSLKTDDGSPLRGFVVSSSRRIVPGMSSFEGELIRLPYGIDGVGLEPGTSFSGYFSFTTSVGEYRLPFTVKAAAAEILDPEGDVLSLEEFVQISKSNFRDAFSIFPSQEFLRILGGASDREKALYKGFLHQPITNQNLEEFLISIRQKKPVKLSLEELSQELYQVSSLTSESFVLSRSGWGHLRIDISPQGSFLEVPKRVLTDEDFIGSKCVIDYLVDPAKLGKGVHYGKILIKSPYQQLTLSVTASSQEKKDISRLLRRQKHALSLSRDLLEYLLGKMPFDEWKASARYALNALYEMGEVELSYQLYEAWVCLQDGQSQQALSILERFAKRTYSAQELELAGSFLYLSLKAGVVEDAKEVVSRLNTLYMRQGDSFKLLYFLLDLDEELKSSERQSLYRMEELYERGCTSPFLYLEAWRRLVKDPGSLHRLSPFWVNVFFFAARNGLYNGELSMRFCYLTGYEKDFSPLVCLILEKIYEKNHGDDALEAIVKYIIRGNPHKARYLKWFSLAVEKGLRLTRLYEYYVEAMDTTTPTVFPKPLLMYFKYNSDTLGDSKKAYIYSNVVLNREKDEQTYQLYEEHMAAFAWEKLLAGKIGVNFCTLYRAYCKEPTKLNQANALARLLGVYRLYTQDPRAKQVIVVCTEMSREEVYPVSRGICFPRLYTKDSVILFQDEKQRRYEATVSYSLTRLFPEEGMHKKLLSLGCEDPGVLLAYVKGNPLSVDTLDAYEKVSNSDAFSLTYRREIRKKLLDYFSSHVEGETLEKYLEQLDSTEYVKVDKPRFIKVLIDNGMYRRSLDVISIYGWEGVEEKALLTLADGLCDETIRDAELLALSYHVFQLGLYSDKVLRYLLARLEGPVDALLQLKKVAGDYGLATLPVEERILTLLIFTSDYRREGQDVLNDFIRHGGKDRLVGAYLTQLSYGTFVHDQAMSSFLLACLYHVYEKKWSVPFICHLALLKELSRGKATRLPAQEVEDAILEECARRGMSFAFFRRLSQSQLSRYQWDDKVFVEIHDDPSARVCLYYRLDTGLGTASQFRNEVLECVCPGVFNKSFTLFYGESLDYYFQVTKAGQTITTSQRSLTMTRVETSSVSKYQRINQMLALRRAGRMEDTVGALTDYLRQNDYVQECFFGPEPQEGPGDKEDGQ